MAPWHGSAFPLGWASAIAERFGMLTLLKRLGRLAGNRGARRISELAHLSRHLPLLDRLGPADRERLAELAAAFLRHKTLEGAMGLEITEPMRNVIALQACLPVLHLGLNLYQGWHAVILYPDEFCSPYEFADEAGVVHQGNRELCGESWQRGPVILAWSYVEAEAQDPAPTGNLIIHEMAHKLDLLNGDDNGMPPLHQDMDAARWARVFQGAFDDLNRHLDLGQEPPIDPYAAESPGEFFAVVSELFFAWPECLLDLYPEVYRLLVHYYRQDPLGFQLWR